MTIILQLCIELPNVFDKMFRNVNVWMWNLWLWASFQKKPGMKVALLGVMPIEKSHLWFYFHVLAPWPVTLSVATWVSDKCVSCIILTELPSANWDLNPINPSVPDLNSPQNISHPQENTVEQKCPCRLSYS